MANIEYIKNVTAFANFTDTEGIFSHIITDISHQNPDEVIIRALNFNGEVDDPNMYIVWSNLNNDYIGSFCGGNLSPHFPQSVIRLNNPIPNLLEFKLYKPKVGGGIEFVLSIRGDLVIHFDLIKYKKTPIHA